MADSNQVEVRIVEESTFGTTPTNSNNWVEIRTTGESIVDAVETEQSEELPGTQRGIIDLTKIGNTVGGDVNFELSASSFDDVLEAVMMGTWSTNVLEDGTTDRSFTVEKDYNDLTLWHKYKGCTFNSFNLSIQKKSKITGSFGLIGAVFDPSGGSAVGTGSSTAKNSRPIFRTGSTVTNIQIDDVDISSSSLRMHGIDLSIAVGTELEDTIDSSQATSVSVNGLTVTLNISCYLSDAQWQTKLVNNTAFKFEFTIADSDGSSYAFVFPNCKLQGGGETASSKDSEVNIDVEAVALYDSTAGHTMQVTRTIV